MPKLTSAHQKFHSNHLTIPLRSVKYHISIIFDKNLPKHIKNQCIFDCFFVWFCQLLKYFLANRIIPSTKRWFFNAGVKHKKTDSTNSMKSMHVFLSKCTTKIHNFPKIMFAITAINNLHWKTDTKHYFFALFKIAQ